MRTSWRGSRAILPAFPTPKAARSFRRWTVTSTDSSRLRSAPKRRAPLPTSFIGIGAAAGAAAAQVLRDHRGVRDVRDALETLVLRGHKATLGWKTGVACAGARLREARAWERPRHASESVRRSGSSLECARLRTRKSFVYRYQRQRAHTKWTSQLPQVKAIL